MPSGSSQSIPSARSEPPTGSSWYMLPYNTLCADLFAFQADLGTDGRVEPVIVREVTFNILSVDPPRSFFAPVLL